MAQFVIVHGAWHGGWAWTGVRTALESAGHTVSTPTMPGLRPDDEVGGGVSLRDCVDALVDHVVSRDFHDLILVGHSWGGIVAGGAVPRIADRVKHLIMFSAFVPKPGESLFDLVPPTHAALFDVTVDEAGPAAIMPKPEAFAELYMNDATPEQASLAYLLARPQPFRTFADPLEPDMNFHAEAVRKTYLLAKGDRALPSDHYWVPRFSDVLGGGLERVAGNHELMFTDPHGLADALMSVAQKPAAP